MFLPQERALNNQLKNWYHPQLLDTKRAEIARTIQIESNHQRTPGQIPIDFPEIGLMVQSNPIENADDEMDKTDNDETKTAQTDAENYDWTPDDWYWSDNEQSLDGSEIDVNTDEYGSGCETDEPA